MGSGSSHAAEAYSKVSVVVALGDRQVELTLGRGLDDPERRGRAAEIVRDTLAPRLKTGDVGGALVAAARESATRIFYAVEVVEPELGKERLAQPPDSAPVPPESRCPSGPVACRTALPRA